MRDWPPLVTVFASVCVGQLPRAAPAQTQPAARTSLAASDANDAQALYRTIRSFEPTGGGTARVENLRLKRDRAQMTFTGSLYLAAPAGGRVTRAVFIGEGTRSVK